MMENSIHQANTAKDALSIDKGPGNDFPVMAQDILSKYEGPAKTTAKMIDTDFSKLQAIVQAFLDTASGPVNQTSANRISCYFQTADHKGYQFNGTLAPAMPMFRISKAIILFTKNNDGTGDHLNSTCQYHGYAGAEEILLTITNHSMTKVIAVLWGALEQALDARHQVNGSGIWVKQ